MKRSFSNTSGGKMFKQHKPKFPFVWNFTNYPRLCLFLLLVCCILFPHPVLASPNIIIQRINKQDVQSSNLNFTVKNFDNSIRPGAVVKRYSSIWVPLDERTTNSSGVAIWTGIEAGTYNFEVYYKPSQTPAANEFWGSNQIVLPDGLTTNFTFTRHAPIVDTSNGLVYPAYINIGQSANITLGVRNLDSYGLNVRVYITIDMSKTPPYDIPEYLCSPTQQLIPASGTFQFTCNSPAINNPGSYYIYYRIESQYSTIWSPTDQNNWGGPFVVRTKADLVVTTVSASPSTVYRGSSVLTSFTIANQGQTDSYSSIFNEIRLSTDTIINASDTLLGNCNTTTLPANSSRNLSCNVTIPSSTPAGSYYLGVIADIPNLTDESNETNNTNYTNLTVLFVPGTINVTVRNSNNTLWPGVNVFRYRVSGSTWIYLDSKTTNSSGIATWLNIPPDTYGFEAYWTPVQSPAATEFWGATGALTLNDGGILNPTITRNYPIVSPTNGLVLPPSDVFTGSSAPITLGVKNINPSSQNVRVRMIIDRNKITPYDIPEYTCLPSSYTISPGATYQYNCASPVINTPGQYYVYYRIETYVNSTWTATDQNGWSTPFTVRDAVGNLYVTVHNVDNTPKAGAVVQLYQVTVSGWMQLDTRTTDANGVTSPGWTALPAGDYAVEVYWTPVQSPAAREFWGNSGVFTLVDGETETPTVTRNYPIVSPTNGLVLPPSDVFTGSSAPITLGVKNINPSSQNVRVRMIIDRDKVAPYDLSMYLCLPSEYTISTGATYQYNCASPVINTPGQYYVYYQIETVVNYTWTPTDQNGWSTPFTVRDAVGNLYVTVHNLDNTPKAGAVVHLFQAFPGWVELDTRTTGADGVTSPGWTALPAGEYAVEVYWTPTQSPAANEFWGQTGIFTLNDGETLNPTITRNYPIVSPTNGLVLPPADVFTGNSAPITLGVKNINPNSQNVRVRMIIDRDKVAPYDLSMYLCLPSEYTISTGATYQYNCASPVINTPGQYYVYYQIETVVNYTWTPTDQNGWSTPFTVRLGPQATILNRSVSPTTVIEGDVFHISLTASNTGEASGWGGISISFPWITYLGLQADVYATSDMPGAYAIQFYERGDTIYSLWGQTTALYLLVEASTPNWQPGETYTLEITVTPKQTGNFLIWQRFALTSGNFESRDPASGNLDYQQGYPVYDDPQVIVNSPAVSIDVPILMYHKVDDIPSPSEWWVESWLFAEQMNALEAYGYTSVTFDDFLAYRAGTKTPPSHPVILTFDDGYMNFYEHAAPILQAHDFTGVSFLPTAYIAENAVNRYTNYWDSYPENQYLAYMMIWPEVTDLTNFVEFSSHTLHHLSLPSLSDSQIWDEVHGSYDNITNHLNQAPLTISYPFGEGANDARVRGLVQQAGYQAAVGAWGGIENTGTADIWALKRIEISQLNGTILDPAHPDNFFMRQVDPDFPLPFIDNLTVQTFDLDGHARDRFYPGETIHFIVSAHNSGSPASVVVSLNADLDNNNNTLPIYDSHKTTPSQDIILDFSSSSNASFDYYWTVPDNSSVGPYYYAVGFHDQYYVIMYRYLDWTQGFSIGSLSEINFPDPQVTAQDVPLVPVAWDTVISDTTSYEITAFALPEDSATLNILLDNSPLYGNSTDSSLVQALAVYDVEGNPVTDAGLAFNLVVANNNIEHVKLNTTLSSYDLHAIDSVMLINTGTRTDYQGHQYHLWVPSATTDWWRFFFLHPLMDNYETRINSYQEVLYNLILQPEVTKRMIDDGSANKLFIELVESGLKGAGNIPELIHLLEKMDNMEFISNGVTTLSKEDYFNIFLYSNYGKVTDEFLNSQAGFLDQMEIILTPVTTYMDIHNKVLQRQFEDMLVNRLAFIRMEQLERWINANQNNLDPALVAAFPVVKQDIISLANTTFDADAEGLREAFGVPGRYLDYVLYLSKVATVGNALFARNAAFGVFSKTASHALAPYIISYQIIKTSVEDFSYIHYISLAATLYKSLETDFYAKKAQLQGGDYDVRLVNDLNLINSYGWYLSIYFYSDYLQAVNIGGFWDAIDLANWGKDLGTALAIMFGSRQEVINDFKGQIEGSYHHIIQEALSPSFSTRQQTLAWFSDKITLDPQESGMEIQEILIAPGEETTITFLVDNQGGSADPYYTTISFSPELDLLDYPTDWLTYPSGTLLWGLNDVYQPTHISTMPVAEVSEPFIQGSPSKSYALTFRGDTPGKFEIKYRVAMVPQGLSHAESLVQRSPYSGLLDQQEYAVKIIHVTVIPPPEPTISTDISSLNLVIGQTATAQIILHNNGGASSPGYVDVSVSGGLDIISISPSLYWQRYDVGDTIWYRDGTQMTAQNLLYSMETPFIPSNTTITYTMQVKATEAGSFNLYVRTALNPITGNPDYINDTFIRDPNIVGSGIALDQQGWWAYSFPITIQPNQPPQIISLIPQSPAVIPAGTPTNFEIEAFDPEGAELTYRWFLDGVQLETSLNSVDITPELTPDSLHSMIVYASDGIYESYALWEIHVVDGTPPIITHNPITIAYEGSPISINCFIFDQMGVVDAMVYYRGSGQPDYQSISLTNLGNNNWSGLIPGNTVNSPQLEYYLLATDGINPVTHGSDQDPHIVVILSQPDNEPPVIFHSPVIQAYSGSDLSVSAYVTDNTSVAQVVLCYKNLGATDFITETMTSLGGIEWQAIIPGNQVIKPILYYYLMASDGVNTGYYADINSPVVVDIVDFPDTIPPTIEHIPVTYANENTNININATIIDNLVVSDATLFYRVSGDLDFMESVLTFQGEDTWAATIPAQYVTSPGVEYYLLASDGSNETTHGSSGFPHVIQVLTAPDSESPIINHNPVTNVVEGESVLIQAVITDNVGVSYASLLYKKGSDTIFNGMPMVQTQGSQWEASIPASIVTRDDVNYYIYASDGVNGSMVGPYIIDVASDLIPPIIQHNPVTEAPANTSIPIDAHVTDDIGVQAVILYYRVTGFSFYNSQIMQHGSGDLWEGNIPVETVTSIGVEYYIEALDTVNSVLHGTPTSPHIIQVMEDAQCPEVIINDPLSGQIINDYTYVLLGTATDDNSGVVAIEVSVDGGNTWIQANGTTTWSFEWQVRLLNNSEYTIMVRGLDLAGNLQSPATTVTVIISNYPEVQYNTDHLVLNESLLQVSINVNLNKAPRVITTVDFQTVDGTALASSDYISSTGTLTFLPGQISHTIIITIINDTINEDDETFTVSLSNPTNAILGSPSTITLAIVDDDPPPLIQLSSSMYSGGEASGSIVVTATLSSPSGKMITVDYASSDGIATAGSDYISTNGILTFVQGETSHTITIPILDDTIDEDNETFSISLSNPTNATLGSPTTATLTIIDDDSAPQIHLSISEYSGGEASGSIVVTATLSSPSGKMITVDYASSDGTATAGSDYISTNGILTFIHGETSHTFTIPILDDTIDEDNETFSISLSNPTNVTLGSPATATLTIIDDDSTPQIHLSSSEYSGGEASGSIVVTATLSSPSGKMITVDYASSDDTATAGSDYISTNGILTFIQGETSHTITIPILDDTIDEDNETFSISLSNPTNVTLGSPATAVLTIIDDDKIITYWIFIPVIMK
jgi:peptidoglycan/xylan/chitin deacetylase (PgdA/CDA1 family)